MINNTKDTSRNLLLNEKVKQLFKSSVFTTALTLFILSCILSILSPYFLSIINLTNVVVQAIINSVLAVGITFVIITAGIDLSVGSILALSGMVMASFMKNGASVFLAIIIACLIGGICGLINGILITKGKMPPFIATLGMMSVARGLALYYSGGRPISGFSQSFRAISSGKFLSIPIPIIITAVIYIIAYIVLNNFKLGRYIYAIGGNEEAARLSGVNVVFYKTSAYVISGITSAIAAVLLTARLNSAQPIAGIGYELDAIAATVLGGTSQSGGQGTIQGTLIGALLMSVIRNGLNLLDVSSHLQQVVIGIVIVIAVLLDSYRQK